jgi:cytidine diphosphoramidate kinase
MEISVERFLEMIWVILCKMLSEQGIHIVCATMSLFPEVWGWNRKSISNYFEVFIEVDSNVLLSRDPKGIYSRAMNGTETNVIGKDIPFQKPSAPDLIIQNNVQGIDNLQNCASEIISAVKAKYKDVFVGF